ncbi:MAG: hypothetical protein JO008_19605 [Alphaproteobacteria bacterium]|nr:hypothetical protein [Alphaproteobacteria bacterium]
MSNYLEYTDEEIHKLLRRIMDEQKSAVPADDPAPEAEAKPHNTTSEVGITRDLSIEEILKKMQAEIADKTPAPVSRR